MAPSPEPNRFYNLAAESSMSQAGLIPYPEPPSEFNDHGRYNYSYRPMTPSSLQQGISSHIGTSSERSPPATAPFTPDSTWRVLEPDLSPKRARHSYPDSSSTSRTNARILLRPHRTPAIHILASVIPTLAATAQLLLLVFFLDVYVTLPLTPMGQRPRISPVYSIWPYIACVGNLRLTAYRVFGFFIAVFTTATFVADLTLQCSRPTTTTTTDTWLRSLRLAASTVSSGALIAVVFAAADYESHLHLYLVSVQGFALAIVKGLTWTIDRRRHRRLSIFRHDSPRDNDSDNHHNDRNINLLQWWRLAVYIVSVPVGLLAVIGIYACRDPQQVQTPGSTCYILVAISAICDWVYQCVGVVFLASLAFELYICGRWDYGNEDDKGKGSSDGVDIREQERGKRRWQVKHGSRGSESRAPLVGSLQV